MDVGSAVERAVVPISGPNHSRRHYRQRIYSLAYVNVNQGNGGIVRDLSESGLAVQTVAALRQGEEVSLQFEVFGPRVKMEATGRVAWSTPTGQAGIEFTSMPSRLKRSLKEWIFIQILTTAHNTAWDSMFREAGTFSGASSGRQMEAIELATTAVPSSLDEGSYRSTRFSTWRISSPQLQAWAIDGLVILSGVLLFWVIALSITKVSPGWRSAALIMVASGAVFAGVYRAVFALAAGQTPGNYFAGTSRFDTLE